MKFIWRDITVHNISGVMIEIVSNKTIAILGMVSQRHLYLIIHIHSVNYAHDKTKRFNSIFVLIDMWNISSVYCALFILSTSICQTAIYYRIDDTIQSAVMVQ